MKRLLPLIILLFAGYAQAGGYLAPVKFDEDSVIVNLPLFQETDPAQFFTGGSHTTTGLTFTIISDRSSGNVDVFSQSDSTLEACSAQGTFSTPTATKARICETSATGIYQLQIPNEVYAATSASRLDMKVGDGANTAVMDDWFWFDLKAATVDDVATAVATYDCSSNVTEGEMCYQVHTRLNGVNTTLGTVNTNVSSLNTAVGRQTLWTGSADTVPDSLSFTIDTGIGDDGRHVGRLVCAQDADNPSDEDCVRIAGYIDSSGTFSLMQPFAFTLEAGDPVWIPTPGDGGELRQMAQADANILNCEVNTLNFAGSTTTLACILTDRDGTAVTQASGDLEGRLLEVLSGDQIREQRYINDTTWDGANSELQLTLSRALPGTLADGVTAVIR